MTRDKHTIIFLILLAIIPILLSLPATLGQGLPSFKNGYFHTATIGYYLETGKLLDTEGWWARSWCLCGQDILRFYPPIGNLLLALLIKLYPTPGGPIAVAYPLAIALVSSSLAYLGYILSRGSKTIAIALALSPLILHSYTVTIAGYWEYTRILGDALAFYALACYMKGLIDASRKCMLTTGILAGLTLLTSLITTVWLASAILAVTLEESYRAYKESPYPGGTLYPFLYLTGVFLAGAAVSLWWLFPAIAPFGVSHFLRIQTPFRDKIMVLLSGLHILPPGGMDSPWPILLLLGGLSAILLWRRYGYVRPFLLVIVGFILVLGHGQGTRMTPYLELALFYSLLVYARLYYLEFEGSHERRGRGGRKRILVAGLVLLLVLLAVGNIHLYIWGLHRDNSYLASDEYKLAGWLSQQPGDIVVYVMYGSRLHGNQWINYFAPGVNQVLSGYMEGCLDRSVFLFDWAFKNTLDTGLIIPIIKQYNITILAIDKNWLTTTKPNIIQVMTRNKMITPVNTINTLLNYTIIYKVNQTLLNPQNNTCKKATGLHPQYITPARILGLGFSITAAILLWGYTKKII